jgi:XTP/dITP diphosphohydrolase
MQQLIVATRNRNKTREIQQILGPKFDLRDLTAYPQISQAVESGKSFEENATLKAIAVSKELSGLVIADDSGLEVAALDGAPGIYSARYAGDQATDKENIDRLLGELGRIGAQRDQRRARFRCVLALARNGQMLGMFEGIADGAIADQPRGSRGFGYDPIFVPKEFKRTFAELPAELKNRISHRAQAIHVLAAKLMALKPSD